MRSYKTILNRAIQIQWQMIAKLRNVMVQFSTILKSMMILSQKNSDFHLFNDPFHIDFDEKRSHRFILFCVFVRRRRRRQDTHVIDCTASASVFVCELKKDRCTRKTKQA